MAAAPVGRICRSIDVSRQTVTKRVAEAQAIYGDSAPALVFDAPLGAPPRVAQELNRPVADREWLTRVEGAALVGCHPATMRNWHVAGLLPHTRIVHSTLHLFLRADVLRIAGSERYRNHGVNWPKARAAVEEARIRDRLGIDAERVPERIPTVRGWRLHGAGDGRADDDTSRSS